MNQAIVARSLGNGRLLSSVFLPPPSSPTPQILPGSLGRLLQISLPFTHTHTRPAQQTQFPPASTAAHMAPLLLLFLLGGLCALFSLTSSSRAGKKCDGAGGKCGGAKSGGEREEVKGKARHDPEADLGIAFSTFDHDGDGFITASELEESLRRLGIAVSADAAKAMVARVDANSDGLIDIHEFRELYESIPKKRKQQQQQAADAKKLAAAGAEAAAAEEEEEVDEEEAERDLREAFDVFDGNKDGLISAEELGTVLGSLGLRQHGAGRPAVAECRDMIRLVDTDGDGMVSFEEFKRMMTVVKA